MESIYEVVKTVNGRDIYRMKGTRRYYHVAIRKNVIITFHTIKAAAAYIESSLS